MEFNMLNNLCNAKLTSNNTRGNIITSLYTCYIFIRTFIVYSYQTIYDITRHVNYQEYKQRSYRKTHHVMNRPYNGYRDKIIALITSDFLTGEILLSSDILVVENSLCV